MELEPLVSNEVSPAVYNTSGAFFSSTGPSGARDSLVLSSVCISVLTMPFALPPSPLALLRKCKIVQFFAQTHIYSFADYS